MAGKAQILEEDGSLFAKTVKFLGGGKVRCVKCGTVYMQRDQHYCVEISCP